MTQSASGPYPVRPIDENEIDGFIGVDEHAFNTSPWSADDRRVALDRFEFDRTLAAFDDTTPVGVTMCYSFQLSVPGLQMLPAAGVTFVAVMPTYRRQGVLSSLMRRQLADVRDRGEPLAILWASEAVIYGRYGYGRASWHLDFTLRGGEGRLAGSASAGSVSAGSGASAGDGLRLRIAEPEAALPELAKVYDAVLASRPGMFGRNDAWWRSAIFDPAEQRHGASPLRCLLAEDASGPRGYALYAGVDTWTGFLPENVLTVRELMAADPAASAALCTDLLSRDLTTEFRLPHRPVDDPLLYQLADPRRTRPKLNDNLWVRIVDLPRALAGRRYSCPVDVVLEVRDEILPANAGRWRLSTTTAAPGGGLAASCVPASSPADLALDVTELGAAYLGGTRLGALAGSGLIAELRPGATRQLSAALIWDPAPWCPMVF
ncbi:MAG TPA: GNAT family N-acetyltransferase [Streptosporangiaceae bacterium]|nr:GNAT family N-acetyltransferase [Streptosporangiaceae bacterium]